jgi:hypothetical protein
MSLRLLAWLCPPNHPRVTTADRMALIHYRAVHALEFGWSWREHDAVIMFGRDAASRVPRHAEDSTRVADWTHSFLTADVFRYVNNVCCLHRFHAVNETLVLMEPAFLEEVVANLAARALAMGAAGLRLSYDGFNTRTMVRIPGQDGQRMSGAEAFSIGILGDSTNWARLRPRPSPLRPQLWPSWEGVKTPSQIRLAETGSQPADRNLNPLPRLEFRVFVIFWDVVLTTKSD